MALIDMGVTPTRPVMTIFDTVGGVVSAVPSTSITAQNPTSLYISALAVGTTVAVEVSPDGVDWYPHGAILDGVAGVNQMVVFQSTPNFARTVRTGVAVIIVKAVS